MPRMFPFNTYVSPAIIISMILFHISAVRCNETEMTAMVPAYAMLASARNRLTGSEYGTLEKNQFPQYGNVVTIQCMQSFFFPDRKLTKEVECTLADSQGLQGKWVGYSGTQLPLAKSCERELISHTGWTLK